MIGWREGVEEEREARVRDCARIFVVVVVVVVYCCCCCCCVYCCVVVVNCLLLLLFVVYVCYLFLCFVFSLVMNVCTDEKTHQDALLCGNRCK